MEQERAKSLEDRLMEMVVAELMEAVKESRKIHKPLPAEKLKQFYASLREAAA